MRIKPALKTLWISLLSTFTLVLAQTLTAEGFKGINTIRLSFLQVPFEYLVINFFVFVLLTILFIMINEMLPFRKLSKGIVYAAMVSIIWIALRFQPSAFEDFRKYIFDSFVFMIPMLIYGIFLGYLATEKTATFKFQKQQYSYLIISITWILFHLIYVFVSSAAKGQVLNYIVWLIIASLIIGFIFGLIYEFSLESKKNSFYISSFSVILIFSSFYAYQYAINRQIDVQLFIRVALDIASIILAVQVLEIYLNRFKSLKK